MTHELEHGDMDYVFSATYEELRRLAFTVKGALDELARVEPRQALIVESRFCGGFEVAGVAVTFEVSEATILRDWRAAKAWLAHPLRQ